MKKVWIIGALSLLALLVVAVAGGEAGEHNPEVPGSRPGGTGG